MHAYNPHRMQLGFNLSDTNTSNTISAGIEGLVSSKLFGDEIRFGNFYLIINSQFIEDI